VNPPPAGEAVEAAAELLGPIARTDVPLGPLTTYRVGGRAALFVDVIDDAGLEYVHVAVRSSGVATLVVGRGSNLLIADSGFRGLALRLGGSFEGIEVAGARVRAGGAVSLPVLARRTASAALRGLEWAVGVPGSVGGGVRMNAGGHGAEMANALVAADVVDLLTGAERRRTRAALDLSYRHSNIGPRDVVTGVEFTLRPGDRGEAEADIADVVRWRRENQPGGSNAGSVFTNPPGDSAGRLIDAAGLKGFRVGSAFVSPKHANFFQADEGGSADDVRALIDEVQRLVAERTGVRLEPELRLVGFV
jgi:UDP-N-acetylmuramate dehydrogenase